MKTVAVIPARGGSRRLEKKNIRTALGKPLLQWVIEAAAGSKYIEAVTDVLVSTDDPAIAGVARGLGASVIDRPSELAGDKVWTEPVIQHAVQAWEGRGQCADIVLWLNASIPEITSGDIDRAVSHLLQRNLREVFAVDEMGICTSAVRVLRREALFQQRLSVVAGVIPLPYIDVHYESDLKEVESRLAGRRQSAASASYLAHTGPKMEIA